MNACTVCKYITNKERCPVCGNPTSDNWSGLLIITKPEESSGDAFTRHSSQFA